MRDHVWRTAVDAITLDGLRLEFGVATGGSIKALSRLTNSKWYGFDSFKGLPEAWHTEQIGGFACDIPDMTGEKVELIVGLFQDTLDDFLKIHKENISILHIDCDIYSATKFVFDKLQNRILPGTIIIFDELRGYNGWEDHEYKAFMEFLDATKLSYQELAEVAGTVYAVKIIKGE